jgi:hypothetical protein
MRSGAYHLLKFISGNLSNTLTKWQVVPDHVWHGVGFCLGLDQYIRGTPCHPISSAEVNMVPTRLFNSSTYWSSAHAHMPDPMS